METNEKEKYEIPLDVQIGILRMVKASLMNKAIKVGLCNAIYNFTDMFLGCTGKDHLKHFRFFKKKNALIFNAGNGDCNDCWWWETGKNYDYENRINFVQWMIDETIKLQENGN